MKKYLFLFAVLCSLVGHAQLKARIANDHFSRLEYALAAPIYSELSQKFLKQKKKDPAHYEYTRRAAFSHLKTFAVSEASRNYQVLRNANQLNENDRENYIQALRYTAQYPEALELANESFKLYPSNSFFKRFVTDHELLNGILDDSLRYLIYPLQLNSEKGDFAPALYENQLIFASKADNAKTFNVRYGWDNDYFLNLRSADLTSDSTTSRGQLLKKEFLTKAHDGPVAFNSSGDEMVITRNRIEKNKDKDILRLGLYFSKKVNGIWTDPVAFQFNSPSFSTGHAVFADNDKTLYFVSDMDGGFGGSDLYVCSKQPDGSWSVPKNMGSTINTAQQELFPFVKDSVLYFASNGHFGLGGLDVFEYDLRRPRSLKNLGYPINTSSDDFGLIDKNNGEQGFFSSNRGDNIDRIYSFKQVPIHIELVGIVYASFTERESIPNQEVLLINETKGTRLTLITNEFGQFIAPIEKNCSYRLSTEKEEFILLRDATFTTDGIKQDSTFFADLPLKPTTLQVRLRVVEMGTGKVIPYAKATITDYELNKESIIHTDEDGIVTIKVDRNKNYWAHASKKGFIDGNVAFNSANENDKIIDLELKLPPIVKGDVFKLENIFYDLNKSTLRPESMMALDKLADFIIKNDVKIELSSHTDARGSDAYNLKLSQARAQSCVDYLISKGVKKTQIIAKGYGETKLINRCKNNVECPEDLHQENRRTEVKIL
jgi:outer membrane protein OmpA-like peptidoglycan-associated protein